MKVTDPGFIQNSPDEKTPQLDPPASGPTYEEHSLEGRARALAHCGVDALW